MASVEIMFRDTCVKSYRESYDKVNWVMQTKNMIYLENLENINAIVKLALIITDDCRS